MAGSNNDWAPLSSEQLAVFGRQCFEGRGQDDGLTVDAQTSIGPSTAEVRQPSREALERVAALEGQVEELHSNYARLLQTLQHMAAAWDQEARDRFDEWRKERGE